LRRGKADVVGAVWAAEPFKEMGIIGGCEREFADAIVGLADLPECLISRSGPFRRMA
jgi:hypothetical protein